MAWFDNMSLRGKLALNFLISGGVLVAGIVFCIVEIQRIGHNVDAIATNWLPSVQKIGDISELCLRYRARTLEYLLLTTDAEREQAEKVLMEVDNELANIRKMSEVLFLAPEENRIFQAFGDYKTSFQEVVALMKAGKIEEANEMRKTKLIKTSEHLCDQTDKLEKINRDEANKAAADAALAITMADSGGISALLIGIILAVICSVFIASRIASRLSSAIDGVHQIAQGDLTTQLPPPAMMRWGH